MSTSDQFLLTLHARREIQAGLRQGDQPLPVLPALASLMPSGVPAPSLPVGSLLLGLDDAGLPVMFDLFDPLAGSILVGGDGGSGKTALLHSMARASNLQDPGDISFGVLTPFPEEWTVLETLPNCLGVWPAYHPSAMNFLSQMVAWAEVLPGTRQAVLLLFDGFDLMTASAFPSRQDLHWLLTNGPERHVWPVVSINPARLPLLQNWWGFFHTCILGQVKQPHTTFSLFEKPQPGLQDLQPGKQFGLFRSGSWQKFWLPPND
jgi:hypothetical protein